MRVLAEQSPVAEPKAMMELADRLKNALGDAAIVLGGTGEGRVHLVVAVTPAVVERGVKAGSVVKVAAQAVGGGGGGRDTMAQAGGRDPEKLPDALAAARAEIERALAGLRLARVLALDYGAARCGTAVSDPTGTLATPLEPVLRPGTRKGLQRIAALARELGAERVVVGLPLSLSGGDSAQTTETRAFADRLGRRTRRSGRALRRAFHDPDRRALARLGGRGFARRGGPFGELASTGVKVLTLSGDYRTKWNPGPDPSRVPPCLEAGSPPTPPPGVAEENLEPLDILLKQIISGFFLLTDGQGAVSKWSEPAELLFGLEASEALGHGFFEKLLDPRRRGRRRRLARVPRAGRGADDARAGRGHRPARDHRPHVPDGDRVRPGQARRGLRLLAVPRGPRLRAPHEPDAAAHAPAAPGGRARAARRAGARSRSRWEGWRTAGTLVAFRPLAPTPWVDEELTRREAERAEKDAEVEERLTDPDPGVRGETIHELDDAAAVVARLLSALERIDELERVAGQFEDARKEVDESVRRAEAAEREAAEVRRALSDVRPAGADVELLARLERLERARLDEQQAGYDAAKALERAEAARRRPRRPPRAGRRRPRRARPPAWSRPTPRASRCWPARWPSAPPSEAERA